jgi:hypothetical protein
VDDLAKGGFARFELVRGARRWSQLEKPEYVNQRIAGFVEGR